MQTASCILSDWTASTFCALSHLNQLHNVLARNRQMWDATGFWAPIESNDKLRFAACCSCGCTRQRQCVPAQCAPFFFLLAHGTPRKQKDAQARRRRPSVGNGGGRRELALTLWLSKKYVKYAAEECKLSLVRVFECVSLTAFPLLFRLHSVVQPFISLILNLTTINLIVISNYL